MKRRAKGTGSVSRRGKYYIARLIVGRENGSPIYRTATRRTKRQAEAELNSWLLNKPTSILAERTTFHDYVIRWLRLPKNMNENTRETRLHALNHVVLHIGTLDLARIERFHIQHVMAKMRERGVGFAMQLMTYRTLRTLFNDLVEDDVIAKSPVRKSDRPIRAAHDRKAPENPLTEEQVETLLAAAVECPRGYYVFYLIAVRLGLREGELLALRCEDVKLAEGQPYLDVCRHLVKHEGRHVEGAFTKTGFARHVLLPKFIAEPLSKLVSERGGTGLLFPAPLGGLEQPKNFFNRNWKKVLKRARLPHMRFHLLRHTAATHAVERNESTFVICQRLGWRSPRMLLERYGHVTRRMEVASVEALDQTYGAKTPADAQA